MPTPDWKWPKLMEGESEINIFLKLLVNFGVVVLHATQGREVISNHLKRLHRLLGGCNWQFET